MKIVFVTYLFLEVLLTISIGSSIGVLMTFIEMVFSAFMGVFLLKNFKHMAEQSLFAVFSGALSAEDGIKSSLLTPLGALLLILPGFLSDFIGIVLQFSFMKVLLSNKLQQAETKEKFNTKKGDDDVIDVEIIEHITTVK